MNVAGGAIKGAVMAVGGRGGEHIFVNNPTMISMTIAGCTYFGVVLIAAIFGNSAVRDFENQSFALYFTKPIKKIDYVVGRFLGSLISCLFILSSIGLGLYIGSLMPWLDASRFGANHLINYIQPYYYLVIPNLITTGFVFFGVALLSRKILSSYIAAIVFFIGYIAASALAGDFENAIMSSLLDPFGLSAIGNMVKYWSMADINTRLFPFSGYLLYNRLLWLVIATAGIAWMISRFRFAWLQNEKSTSGKSIVQKQKPQWAVDNTFFKLIRYRYYDSIKQILHLTKYEFKSISTNLYFFVIMATFLFFLVISATQIGKMFGTVTYPVTYLVVEILSGSFYLFCLIVSTFYAGDLIWRERTQKMDQLIDVTPHKNVVPYLSKLLAVLLMQLYFVGLIIVVGVITQIASGYYHFELNQYIFDLFVLRYIAVVNLTLLAFFFQALFNHKYTAYFATILFYALLMFSGKLGIDHNLLVFNLAPTVPYSDMNGYGHFLKGNLLFKGYWLLFSVLLTIIGLKFWSRGKEANLMSRWQAIHDAGYDKIWKTGTVVLVAFVCLGGYLFYNTNILNKYISDKETEKMMVTYEKTYKKYERVVQPRIRELNVNIDITPSQRKMEAKGFYWLKNISHNPIDTLIVTMRNDVKLKAVNFGSTSKEIVNDNDYGFRMYKLQTPIAPQDSIKMQFTVVAQEIGIPNSNSNTDIVYNGTFFHNDYFPSIGYSDGFELSNNDTRKKYGLSPKDRMAKITDTKARNNVYVSKDADWIRFESIISTEKGQLAFAPGALVCNWDEGNRSYFQYKMNRPILYLLTFVSGKYDKIATKYKNIPIEVYYYHGHPYNVKTMLQAAKHSLTYCSTHYMPYPFPALRIIEFPRYASYAQSIPTMVPFSEAIGFIAKVDPKNPKDVDYPYYVTTHEVSHQWWAHVIIGADVQGSTMLSEALAQYTALMCMKEKYGKDRMRRFLSYENDSYLMGRSMESKTEEPLYLVENQQYIHYNKGSLVTFALQDYIGENTLDNALGKFCRDHAFQGPPYLVSTDLLAYLKKATPTDKQYVINDLFENITLFDNKIESAKVKLDPKTKNYITTVTFTTKKAHYNGLGVEKKIPVKDYMDVAVYEKDNEHPIAFTNIAIHGGKETLQLTTSKKPSDVVLDPFYKLINKSPNDSKKAIK